jgi:hypothetical protein
MVEQNDKTQIYEVGRQAALAAHQLITEQLPSNQQRMLAVRSMVLLIISSDVCASAMNAPEHKIDEVCKRHKMVLREAAERLCAPEFVREMLAASAADRAERTASELTDAFLRLFSR